METGTEIYIDPILSSALIGENFQVNISVSQVNDLAGWDFKLYYPNEILNATSITEGPFLQTAGATLFWIEEFTDDYNETFGRIWAACVLQGQGSGASGNGTLATVTFKPKSNGNATLNLDQTELIDSQMPPQDIEHLTSDGLAQILTPRDLAVTDISIIKTVAAQNFCARINVTVANQGDLNETFTTTLEGARGFSVVDTSLFGSASEGWGFTPSTITSPGPTIVANEGDFVSLELTSQDSAVHSFFIDYDGDAVPDAGEPTSPDFTTTTHYGFDADTTGSFTYYCQYNKITMYGDFVVNTMTPTTIQIGMQNRTLASGASEIITFYWDTTGATKGNYTISANIDVALGENDTDNNELVDGWVLVTLAGDVDGDLDVDIFDIVTMSAAYGSSEGELRYAPNCDLNCDGKVDIFDIVIAAGNYGQTA